MKSIRKFNTIRFLVVALLLAMVFSRGDDSRAQTVAGQELVATVNFKVGETLAPDSQIEVSLNRALPENEKLASVAMSNGKSLVVSGIKRKNRATQTLDAKQLAEHVGKRAQRGKLCDVGFRPDRLGE